LGCFGGDALVVGILLESLGSLPKIVGPAFLIFLDLADGYDRYRGKMPFPSATLQCSMDGNENGECPGMKTLFLLRHGKSSWEDPELPDHERPLARRGVRDGLRMAKHLRLLGPAPELVLCSTARRTAQTLELLLDAWTSPDLHPEPHVQQSGEEEKSEEETWKPPSRDKVEYEHGLYLTGCGVLLQRLRDLPPTIDRILLVGHNPDMQELALLLAGKGKSRKLRRLQKKFPTAACAVLTFDLEQWSSLVPSAGTLIHFDARRRKK
jgi:phosphohistidine phosphatase